MSRIHYFQRYSSIENTVTNNTLQLLARIYEYSARSASRLLSELTGEAIYIGLEIAQQQRAGSSVPDGTLLQRSFKIAIEAKVDAPVDTDQLARHAAGFGAEAQRILLLLTKTPLGSAEQAAVEQVRARFPGVVIKYITFEDICNAVGALFKPHEDSIIELVEDYIEYCNDTGLFDQSRDLMRVVPCGQSIGINQQHGIYFQPSDRGYTPHAYVGVYSQKAVRAVLATKSVFDVTLAGGLLTKTLVDGEPTDRFDAAIRAIIDDARVECDYDIADGHRFFCGDMAATHFEKTSPGGIQGARFINLKEVLGRFDGIADIALRLRERQWE